MSPPSVTVGRRERALFKNDYYLIMNTNLQTSSDATIIHALRKAGYRATSQRIAICRFALRSRDHPSVGRIYRDVKEVHPTVSLATVYKTIQALKRMGRIQELAFPQSETRFDSSVEPHMNLVCLQCGNITDAEGRIARDVVRKVAAETGFLVSGQRLDMYGTCRRCSKRTRPSEIQKETGG